MIADLIPPYVYRDLTPSESSLQQGDILKVDGKFREHFAAFYPAIELSQDNLRHVMVLTQSCDLVKENGRKPKLSHINVCLLSSLR